MTPRRLLLRIYLVTLAQFLAVGLAYTIALASVPHVGTTVTVSLPAHRRERPPPTAAER